jgi:hypothetical protein
MYDGTLNGCSPVPLPLLRLPDSYIYYMHGHPYYMHGVRPRDARFMSVEKHCFPAPHLLIVTIFLCVIAILYTVYLYFSKNILIFNDNVPNISLKYGKLVISL